jgi:hypothetical protein
VPDRAVACPTDIRAWKGGVERLELLEAGDVRRLFFEPKEQVRQSPADAVDIEGGDLDWLLSAGEEGLQHAFDEMDIDRLHDVRIEAGLSRQGAMLVLAVSGHRDDA